MNFTNLYYPTAESANADPDFINKVLADTSITVDITIVPIGSPTIDVFLLDQHLYTGRITEELNLSKTISVILPARRRLDVQRDGLPDPAADGPHEVHHRPQVRARDQHHACERR